MYTIECGAKMAADASIPSPPVGAARTAMIVVLLVSNLLASFTQSLMNVALDYVATDFHITLSQANWMVLAFTIVTATTITMAAKLLERIGLHKLMTIGFVFSFVGSLLGFFAWNYPVMIVARALQAVCTGLCFPLINEALLTIAPKGKAATLLAVNSGVIGVALAFAPPVSGLIITCVGLRPLFLIPAVIALVLIIAGRPAIHNLYMRRKAHIDIPSVALSFVGLACFLYGLNEISHEVFPPLVIMLAGIAILAIFVYRQLHIDEPLLNLTPLRNPVFTVGETLVTLAFMASVYMSLLVPLYLEGAASYSPFIAGCMCIVPILCYAACCFPSGHLLAKHGVWPLVPVGFAIVLIGYIGMYFASAQLLVIVLLACAAIAYAGIGIFFPAVKTVDLNALPRAISSYGSSIHSTIVQIGSSVSSALFVGIMSGDIAHLMAGGMSKADAYAFGFSHTLLIAIGILIVAVILTVVYTRLVRRQKGKTAVADSATSEKTGRG